MTVLEVLGITLLVLLFIWETWYRIQVRRRTRPYLSGRERGVTLAVSMEVRQEALLQGYMRRLGFLVLEDKPRRHWFTRAMELFAGIRHRIAVTSICLIAPLIEAYDRSRDRRVWWSNLVMACVPFQLQALWANYDRRSE
jgi:hypothetical protein